MNPINQYFHYLYEISEVSPDGYNHQRHEAVMPGAENILEHHQEEGGVVEGGQELDEEHGEGIGEEEEDGEKNKQGDAGLVARLPDNRADRIDTSHCPDMIEINIIDSIMRHCESH